MIKKHKRVRTGWMRRTSKVYLRGLNQGKVDMLEAFLNKYQNAVNYTIRRLWSEQNIASSDLLAKSVTDVISERFDVTARLSQCAGKQAKEIVSSQRELSKRKQRIPRLKSHTANLDSRFVTIEDFDGYFDMCIKTSSGVPKLVIPFNWTSHANKFRQEGWLLGNSIRMGYDKSGIFIDLIFEKQKPPQRTEGIVVGIDRGYNVMLACSDGQRIGKNLKPSMKAGGKNAQNNIQIHYTKRTTSQFPCISGTAGRLISSAYIQSRHGVVHQERDRCCFDTGSKITQEIWAGRGIKTWHIKRQGRVGTEIA